MRLFAQQIRKERSPGRAFHTHGVAAALARAAFALLLLPGFSASGQTPPHLSFIQPGGIPGRPVMTGIQRATNGVTVSWYGPPGYYQLFQRLGLNSGAWQATGGFTISNQATITTLHSNAFFKVAGPPPNYAGAQMCADCHADPHDTVVLTPHASAFTNALFVSLGGQTNNSCFACHTVGAGLPTGFTSLAATPKLAGVQCENCHGPAGNHAANPDDFSAIPVVEVAAQMCGGCHNSAFVPVSVAAYHPPRYEEWNTSLHQSVVPDVATEFTQNAGLITTCGKCHSGTVREALLEGDVVPGAAEAGAVAVACATCHEPHGLNTYSNILNGIITNTVEGVTVTITNNLLGLFYTNQLREPLASLEPYHTTGSFATNYNPNINACAQCHNDRGASPTDTAFPPHPSLQYSLLIGAAGVLPAGATNETPTHALIEKQCATCHMQTSPYVSPAQPAVSGHSFEVVSYDACATCHGTPQNAQLLAEFLALDISMEIDSVKGQLDQWATNKAPLALRTKYGARAWEYTTPGSLSPGGPGPTAAEQAGGAVPTNIMTARYNLYLVQNDGSMGVHNPHHCLDLLSNAGALVQIELNK